MRCLHVQIAKRERGLDQRGVRERLGIVAEEHATGRIDLFTEQTQRATEARQPLEE